MDRMHQLIYEQYRNGFDEFYMVYQPMIGGNAEDRRHFEAFIRWQNDEIGMVSPEKIIECVSDFGIFRSLNDFIIGHVCRDIAKMGKLDRAPVVHVNCPSGQLHNFGLNDIIIKHISENNIPAECLCLELEVIDIAAALEDIMLLEEMDVDICIDRFENTEEEQEIIQVIGPKYIKMSLDSLNNDIYASTEEDLGKVSDEMEKAFMHVTEECRKNGIRSCICGIETEAQDELAQRAGFDYRQGYFYGRPERYDASRREERKNSV